MGSQVGAIEESCSPATTTVGWHLLVEFYDCDADVLDDPDRIRHAMRAAVNVIGATVVGETFHHFRPSGVTGVVAIAESHLSIHTWPERRYAAADVFTCGLLDPTPGVEFLAGALDARSCMIESVIRGLPADLQNHRFVLEGRGRAITEMSAPRHMDRKSFGGRR